ncbi:MAG: amidohydrolase family protein, partial [Muribaculaceae bacterium]|nr:amidohydrolase family protein [Muribaculaceae bacterium]
MKIIDAHSHLWLQQYAELPDGGRVRQLPNGRADFFGEERQMLPPFMIDGRNSAEVFLSNMDYAQVAAAVVTQEFIDGNQNEYLEDVQTRFPDRFLCCGMCHYLRPGFLHEAERLIRRGFKAIAIPAHRLPLGKEASVWLNRGEMLDMVRLMERE